MGLYIDMCAYTIRLTTGSKKHVNYIYNSRGGRRLATDEEEREIENGMYDWYYSEQWKGDMLGWYKSVHPDLDIQDWKEFDEYNIEIRITRVDQKVGEVEGCPELVEELHKYFMDTFANGEKELFTSSSNMNSTTYHFDTNSVNFTQHNSSIVTATVRVPYDNVVRLNKLYELLMSYGDITF